MADLTGWHADYNDPFDWQREVLDWLQHIGVDDPADQRIVRVDIEREGEGAQVVVTKYVYPFVETMDGPLVELQRFPLKFMPPARPPAFAA